jgi:transposase-like protein
MPTFTERPAAISTTATGTAEVCPYCRTCDGVRRTAGTGRIHGWVCDHCDTSWAYTVPDTRAAVVLTTDLGAAAQEIGRLRWTLRQVVMLADDAPGLTNEQLRSRLLKLAEKGADCTVSGRR